MKVKLQYTWRELGRYVLDALKSFLTGLIRLGWSVALLVANVAVGAAQTASKTIKAKPLAAVGVTFAVMLMAMVFQHCSYKYKLTTAEWQKGQLQMRLDSVGELRDTTATYSRYGTWNYTYE